MILLSNDIIGVNPGGLGGRDSPRFWPGGRWGGSQEGRGIVDGS